LSQRIAAGLAWLTLLFTACSVEPKVFSPPRQRQALQRASFPTALVVMRDSAADLRIVKDILGGPGEPWRWTAKRPTIRVPPTDIAGLTYQIQFSVAEATFKFTGPVTVTFLVNDKPLGTLRCDKPGERVWKAPVPPEMLRPNAENTIGAEVDKVWTSPRDGVQLGLILTNIGLVR
jgi:hypothetical protein